MVCPGRGDTFASWTSSAVSEKKRERANQKKKALKLQIGCGCCYDDAEEIIKVEILWQVVPPERPRDGVL